LTLSDIPFEGPIGGVIVGLVDGKLVINPVVSQEERNQMHMVVAGTQDAIMMVECGAREVPEKVILEAVAFGHQTVQEIVEFIAAFREEALQRGLASPKVEMSFPVLDPALAAQVRAAAQTAFEPLWTKNSRSYTFN